MAKRKSGKKRGYRTPRPPKAKRMALAAEREAAREEAGADLPASADTSSTAFSKPVARRYEEVEEEDTHFPSVEGESSERQANAEEPADLSSADDEVDEDKAGVDELGARQSTPNPSILEEEDDGRGTAALPGSSSSFRAESEEVDDLPSLPLPPVQPTGEYWIVIYRLSSSVPYKSNERSAHRKSRAQLVADNEVRRVQEGYILAERLATNCPNPTKFVDVWSYCGVRPSTHLTDWFRSSGPISEFVEDIRDWFAKPDIRNKKVTILVRSLDGLHTGANCMRSFLRWVVDHCGVTAQLIFQFNKVFPEIAPMNFRNFRGLGGTVDFDGQDFLDHLEGRKVVAEVARMLEIFAYISDCKISTGGNQDRNILPPEDFAAPEEVSSLSSRQARYEFLLHLGGQRSFQP